MKFRDFLNSLDPRAKSWHPNFISQLARLLGINSYLEVGVYRGETVRKISKLGVSVTGVDIDSTAIDSIKGIRNVTTHLGTVQDHFKKSPNSRYDLIFIDANHQQDAVAADFKICTELLNPSGLILLHDTWPASIEYSDMKYCGDAYLVVDRLREEYADWNFVTIQSHPGLTFCQRIGNRPGWASSVRQYI